LAKKSKTEEFLQIPNFENGNVEIVKVELRKE